MTATVAGAAQSPLARSCGSNESPGSGAPVAWLSLGHMHSENSRRHSAPFVNAGARSSNRSRRMTAALRTTRTSKCRSTRASRHRVVSWTVHRIPMSACDVLGESVMTVSSFHTVRGRYRRHQCIGSRTVSRLHHIRRSGDGASTSPTGDHRSGQTAAESNWRCW